MTPRPFRPTRITDPQTIEMLTHYRAMVPAAKRAWRTMLFIIVNGGPIYPAALRLLRAMGAPDAEARAARFAADMHACKPHRRQRRSSCPPSGAPESSPGGD